MKDFNEYLEEVINESPDLSNLKDIKKGDLLDILWKIVDEGKDHIRFKRIWQSDSLTNEDRNNFIKNFKDKQDYHDTHHKMYFMLQNLV